MDSCTLPADQSEFYPIPDGIDAQYYLIKNDLVGRAALDAYPNFEIRIYNPFHRCPGGRAKSALTGFSRINRRMHNKSFTVDNSLTITGGRNIADKYFDPRSLNLNTEMGVIIHSEILGEHYATELENRSTDFAYTVYLDDRERVRWRGYQDGEQMIYTKQLETTCWDRFKVSIAGILLVKEQL
jgi:phosphatidylserine/phosphatidylglycerophosphate/cardiolipin synthase-like enzyme